MASVDPFALPLLLWLGHSLWKVNEVCLDSCIHEQNPYYDKYILTAKQPFAV